MTEQQAADLLEHAAVAVDLLEAIFHGVTAVAGFQMARIMRDALVTKNFFGS